MESLIMLFAVFLLLTIFMFNNAQNKKGKTTTKLDKEIDVKLKELMNLQSQIENNTMDKNISLTKAQIKALDVYDLCNIRIPSDILEDLSTLTTSDEEEIFKFIENQRNYWKLENTKKPYKGVK